MLERERIANHLGDLGYLGNDGGFAFGLAQFSRLKEDVLRGNLAAFGHRMAMDYIVAGGVARDLDAANVRSMAEQCDVLEREVATLRGIFDEHAGLQDRFRNCGFVTPALAAQLGLTGLAGRASGQAFDLRCDFPTGPYAQISVRMATRDAGDVAARVAVRFDELFESLRLSARSSRACRQPTSPATCGYRCRPYRPIAPASASSKAGAARSSLRSKAGRRARPAAAIRTILRGRTGRCSSTR